MPAKAHELQRAARNLGFEMDRQEGSHQRWKHDDGRAATIPLHGDQEIGGFLFYRILKQLGISEEEFRRLKSRERCKLAGMRSINDYTVVVAPNGAYGWWAYVPAIEGCYAIGDTADEARSELDGVFEMIAEEIAEEGTAWPEDVKELVPVAS